MKVNIQDVVNAIDDTNQERWYYLNKDTMEIRRHDENCHMDDYEDVNWIALPDHRAINDYKCMERFIEQKAEGEAKVWLSNAIRGRGAFRMFRATLDRFYLTQAWYDFKDKEHLMLAMDWCDANGIEFESSKPLPERDDEDDFDEEYEEEIPVQRVSIERPLTFVEIEEGNAENLIYLIASYNSEKFKKKEDLDEAEEQINDWMNQDSVVFVAVEHGRWVGFVMAVFDWNGTTHVQHLYVRKECRKKGYGRSLLNRLSEKAKLVGNGRMDIDLERDQEEARGFLTAVGYSTVLSTRFGKSEE